MVGALVVLDLWLTRRRASHAALTGRPPGLPEQCKLVEAHRHAVAGSSYIRAQGQVQHVVLVFV